jgi:hypothetical protein
MFSSEFLDRLMLNADHQTSPSLEQERENRPGVESRYVTPITRARRGLPEKPTPVFASKPMSSAPCAAIMALGSFYGTGGAAFGKIDTSMNAYC